MNTNDNSHISVEQQRYATLLNWGARSGLAILAASFLAYVFGWLPAHVPVEQLPNVWNLPVGEYLKQTDSPTGWAWLGRLGEGDYAGLFGIAWLSGCSLVCLLAVMPIYARRGDRMFVAICVIALLVQLAAASGMLHSGH
ncbi:MAG: hypothetical protein A2Z95_05355 [Gallionellales bacterium GWA2_60_18]|nr:MAG: hypothetical protein A2Z95_05355 [Gallionellales bacterium GWA2_60_18]